MMDQYGLNWQTPRRGIVKVHGEQGAQMLPMLPDDQCIALDETFPEGKVILWSIATDSRGIKTVCKPYEATEYVPKPPVDMDSINERLKKMEDFIYAKFGTGRAGTESAGDNKEQPTEGRA